MIDDDDGDEDVKNVDMSMVLSSSVVLARWWLWTPILDAQTYVLHFGRVKVWVEDDRDSARSFCSRVFPLRLPASLSQTYS